MSGIVYLMEDKRNMERAKFGHRTKQDHEEVMHEVNETYDKFNCVATYNLRTRNPEDTEFLVKQIRSIINMLSGNLSNEQPEYYNISYLKILSILKAISELRGNPEDLKYPL